MSLLYGSQLEKRNNINEEAELVELYLYDDLFRCNEAQIQEFINSDACKVLVETKAFRKPMVVRLSKEADANRRLKLTVYKMAKDANDPDYTKFKMLTAKRKVCISRMMKKYGARAQKNAVKAQKEYIKLSQHLPANPNDNIR